MNIAVNDLVVNPGREPAGRLIRISRVEPWPVVSGTRLIEDAAVRCHGAMIVFDRLVPTRPASPDELRRASPDEVAQAKRLGLLPPEVDDDPSDNGMSGDRYPRRPNPSTGSGNATTPRA